MSSFIHLWNEQINQLTLFHNSCHCQDFSGPGPALRLDLDDYLEGTPMRELPRLREWVGGLKLIRLAERETEDGTIGNPKCIYLLFSDTFIDD